AAEPAARGRIARAVGVGLTLLAGALLAAAAPVAMARLGDLSAAAWAALAAGLLLWAAVLGAMLLWRADPAGAAVTATIIAVLGHGVAAGLAAPAMHSLWLSSAAAAAL